MVLFLVVVVVVVATNKPKDGTSTMESGGHQTKLRPAFWTRVKPSHWLPSRQFSTLLGS